MSNKENKATTVQATQQEKKMLKCFDLVLYLFGSEWLAMML